MMITVDRPSPENDLYPADGGSRAVAGNGGGRDKCTQNAQTHFSDSAMSWGFFEVVGHHSFHFFFHLIVAFIKMECGGDYIQNMKMSLRLSSPLFIPFTILQEYKLLIACVWAIDFVLTLSLFRRLLCVKLKSRSSNLADRDRYGKKTFVIISEKRFDSRKLEVKSQ